MTVKKVTAEMIWNTIWNTLKVANKLAKQESCGK